jgi:tricarballylate dehydrogenase
VKVDATAAVHFGGVPSANLYAAGEIMAGNVLGQGYTAGVGMTIGTVFGRRAGQSAAAAAAARGAAAHPLATGTEATRAAA